MSKRRPSPLFDSLNHELANTTTPAHLDHTQQKDHQQIRAFLLSYRGNEATYNAYRRELERFFQWCMLRRQTSITDIHRDDIEAYLIFCRRPLTSWIGLSNVPRFHTVGDQRKPNKHWKPFVVTIPKADVKKDKIPTVNEYQLSERSVKEILAWFKNSSFRVTIDVTNRADIF